MTPVSEYWHSMASTWWDVVRLRPAVGALTHHPVGWAVAIGVALTAALSGLVADAGWLAVNRVRGWSLAVAAALVSVRQLLGHTVQGLVVWAACWVLLDTVPAPGRVIELVLLSTAPLWFEALAIAPFVGLRFARVLQSWTLLTMWVLLQRLTGAANWPALAVVGLAWLLRLLVNALLGAAGTSLWARVWQLTMGRPVQDSAADLLDQAAPERTAPGLAHPLDARGPVPR